MACCHLKIQIRHVIAEKLSGHEAGDLGCNLALPRLTM